MDHIRLLNQGLTAFLESSPDKLDRDRSGENDANAITV